MKAFRLLKSKRHLQHISDLWRNKRDLFAMFRENSRGSYRIPLLSVILLIGAVIYIISPIDLIPDFIPVIGWIDDSFVLYLALKLLVKEVNRYQQYKYFKGGVKVYEIKPKKY